MSSWRYVKLGNFTTKVGSGATPRGGKDSYKPAGIPLIRSQNVHFDGFRDDGIAFLDDDQAETLKSVAVLPDDVLLNITGASIGRVTIAPPRMSGARVNQHVCIIRPNAELRPSFLRWFLASPYIQHFIIDIQTGVTRQALTKEQILGFEVPLPPVYVQESIVAEIEKQFSRLDETVTALKRIQANLKRYKAAVLKAAVEGKLTEQWRKEHSDVEPADQLLMRILAERCANWEAEELAKMKAKGIKPKDDSWKKKYKEPAGPDTANLPELPEGWLWASVDQLANVMLGKMLDKAKHQTGRKMAYLRNVNIRWGHIDTNDLLEMYFKDDELERYGLRNGDILVCEGGEPGRAALWKSVFPEMKYQKALHRVRCGSGYDSRMLVALLEHLAKSGRLEAWFTGSTIKHFTKESFVQLPVPLSSMKEQNIILEEIDRRLSVSEELEATIETSLKRAERLRQLILKEVFAP